MTVIEDLVRELLLWLSIMSVNPPPMETVNENLPRVYVVPQEELSETIVGCPTQLLGLYIGGENHIVVISGIEGDDGDVLLVISPQHKSNLVHELQHYQQDLLGELTKEEIEEREREAYEIENQWRTLNNLPPLDVEEMVEFSVEGIESENVCLDGSTPNAPDDMDELREKLHSTVFKYEQNRKLREIYESRDINTTHGQE